MDRWSMRRRIQRSLVPIGCFTAACIGAAVGILLLSSYGLTLLFAVVGSLGAYIGGLRWLDRAGGPGTGPDRGLIADMDLAVIAVAAAFIVGGPILDLRDEDLIAFVICVAGASTGALLPGLWG